MNRIFTNVVNRDVFIITFKVIKHQGQSSYQLLKLQDFVNGIIIQYSPNEVYPSLRSFWDPMCNRFLEQTSKVGYFQAKSRFFSPEDNFDITLQDVLKGNDYE